MVLSHITCDIKQGVKKHVSIVLTIVAILTACSDGDGSDNRTPSTSEDSVVRDFIVGAEEAIAVVGDPSQSTTASLPLKRALSEAQQALSARGHHLDVVQRWEYQALLPKSELFCDQPTLSSFTDIAEKLGGFSKARSIRVEPDATTPTLLDGIEPYNFHTSIEGAANDVSASAVNIQRPDSVKRQGNKAFYLSDSYGLIQLNFNEDVAQTVQVSCAMALPGRLNNFVATSDSLFVLAESLQGMGVAVIEFSIGDTGLTYRDALYFDHAELVDARLFNDTLALYVKVYEAESQENMQELTSARQKGAVVRSSPIMDVGSEIRPKPLMYQLKIIETQEALAHKYSVTFDSDNSMADEIIDDDESWTRDFNPFVSASGEYLVVSENIKHRYISHYETRNYSRCTDWQPYTYSYEYCNVNWTRINNPDYQPLPASGVLHCQGDLLSCLQISVPKINRYLYVADGQTCDTMERTRYSCINRIYGSYERPVYKFDGYTKLHLFRFKGGEFYKLDDKLASLDENMKLTVMEDFRLDGTLVKHDHLQFNGDYLYVVTRADRAEKNKFQTLMLEGNSIVLLDQMDLSYSNGYTDLAVHFTPNKAYISESNYYNQPLQWSDMQTISLAEPAHPVMGQKIKIPTSLDQLLFSENLLLGLGIVSIQSGVSTTHLASVSAFSSEGENINSLLLGAGYRYTSAAYQFDDQSVHVDSERQRLMVPYTSNRPINTDALPVGQHRLTMADFSTGSLFEEFSLSLPEIVDRSLSVADSLAFVFSREFIHSLINEGGWHKKRLFDGELPSSIYYSREQDLHVQKFSRIDQTIFKLIGSADDTSAEQLDELSVSNSASYCVPQQMYFDRDRILIVQAKPGMYFSYNDCAAKAEDNEFQLTGYDINASGFQRIEDQSQLLSLYQQIQSDLHCVSDINNLEGKRVDRLPEGSKLSCYTYEQYWQLRDASVIHL